MTPAPQQLTPPRRAPVGLLAALLGLLLLAALFLPAREPMTHGITVDWRPSAELACLLFLVAMMALAAPRVAAARSTALILAVLAVAAALLNLADAVIPTLLGRDLSLYWDVQNIPSLVGLVRDSAGPWRVIAAVILSVSAVSGAIAGVYWIWRKVLVALTDQRVAVGAAVLLGLALDVTAFVPPEQRPLATGFGRDLVRHAAVIERGWQVSSRTGGPLPPVLAGSGPPRSDLAGLKQRDVYLIYIESYGTTVFDTPEFRTVLREPLARFEEALRSSGYTIASNRLVSPTFGGGSWLAHATLASGVRLADPVLYTQLLSSGRKLLPSYVKDAGWRAIDIMPGTKEPSPEARAWGFDREVYAAELGYHGPSFGWFAIPDQFTLDRARAIRSGFAAEPPVFTQIVLVSSHIPFSPVPPYLTNWADAGTFATVPAAMWERIYRPPDWTSLAPAYLKSLDYDFSVLGDWLSRHLPGEALVILLGDHQPPGIIGGELHEWTVPIHVLSRDPGLVAPFIAQGYVAGLVPTQRPPHPGMEQFLWSFLTAFDRAG